MRTRFEYTVTNTSDTGLQVLRLIDNTTGIVVNTVIPNSDIPTASVASYVAARYSRSSKSVVELLTELVDKGTDAVAKMGDIFNTYGHASVADMAGVFCFIENIPSVYATRLFMESSVGAGMERSTRYQNFGNIKPDQMPTLESFLVNKNQPNYSIVNEVFIESQVLYHTKYKKWLNQLTSVYADHYSIDCNITSDYNALKARVYDTARAFLPWGGFNKTSLGYLTSAREWSRLIAIFKGSNDNILIGIGVQLEMLLAPSEYTKNELKIVPEVDELIRYTRAEETVTSNVKQLTQWLSQNAKFKCRHTNNNAFEGLNVQLIPLKKGSVKTLEGYIAVIYPLLSYNEIQEYVSSLSEEQLEEISYIIFNCHTQHKQLPIMARNGDNGFVLNCTFAEMRDMNRHRAFGRYCPLVLCDDQVIKNMSHNNNWIIPPYLDSMPRELKQEFLSDVIECNLQLRKFEDVAVGISFNNQIYKHLWLFCQVTPYYMFGSTKDVHYITHLRVRPGGHISYRILSQMMAKVIADDDPLMAALDSISQSDVNPNDRTQFLDRS